MNSVFQAFDKGTLEWPTGVNFAELPWTAAAFEGVELKHLLTGAQTDGEFSFHLVRIAPGRCIGKHVHATQCETHEVVAGSGHCLVHAAEGQRVLPYAVGTMAVFPTGLAHEVVAGEEGLCLFAKFFPALC